MRLFHRARDGNVLTDVGKEYYRAIAPAIQDGALLLNGETIQLEPRNAQKVAQAVAELRGTLPAAKQTRALGTPQRLTDIDARCEAIVSELREISSVALGKHTKLLAATLDRACGALIRLKMDNGFL